MKTRLRAGLSVYEGVAALQRLSKLVFKNEELAGNWMIPLNKITRLVDC